MKKLNNFCATFIFLLLAVSAVFTSCADLYDETELDKNELCIASTGSDTDGDGTGIKPYKTLEKALNHIKNAGLGSNAEWIVYVLDEVICSQEISPTNFVGSKLTLQGINNRSGLNGNQQGIVLTISAPGTFELKKLKIKGGLGTNGGGICLNNSANNNSNTIVIIDSDSVVTSNTATYGAGVIIFWGTLKVYGSITSNTANSSGGGIYNKGIVDFYGDITYNTATTGGGIYNTNGATINLYGNYTLSDNSATNTQGVGIYNESSGTIYGDVTRSIDSIYSPPSGP